MTLTTEERLQALEAQVAILYGHLQGLKTIVHENLQDKFSEFKDKSPRFTKPKEEEVDSYISTLYWGGNPPSGKEFIDFYESRGWMIGKSRMKDWKAAVRTWRNRRLKDSQLTSQKSKIPHNLQ